MTRVLTTDDKNDIFLDATGRLAISTNLDAVLQACEYAAKAQLGEMILAIDKGVPNFATIWNGIPNIGQFEAAVRAAILAVDGVVRVVEFSASRDFSTLSYSATIETIYGAGIING